MLQRVVTGVLGAAVALAAILWREPWGFLLLLLAVALVGVIEILRLDGKAGPFALLPWAAGCLALALLFQLEWSAVLGVLGALWLVGATALIIWKPNRMLEVWGLLAWLFAGLGVGWCLYLQDVELGSGALLASLLLLALVPIWVGDSLAFFVGRAFGKRLMAPSVSPKKTWEGAVANLVGCVVTSLLLASWFGVPMGAGVAVGLSTGIVGQVGDLLQSRVKRLAGVKDSGRLLPGHGGILDRLDSFLLSSFPSLAALYSLSPEMFHVKPWPW